MKKIFLAIIFLLFLFPSITNAATITQSELDKMVQTPSLQIRIPGLNFSDSIRIVEEDNKTYLYNTFFQEYIVAVYKYSVVAISILAVVMIIFAGIQWLTSGGSPDKIKAAQKRIGQSIIGIVIIVGSYTILYTINPYLVGLNALKTQYFPEEFVAEYAMSSEIGNNSLAGVVGVIPQLKDGLYSVDLKVPSANSCSNVCINVKNGTRCADQSLRDMAYEAQTKTGYPAAVLLAQYMIEGPTFGLTCSGSFVPSERGDESAIKAANCDTTKCGAGFTWECTNKEKYTSQIKAARDLKNGATINCGSGDKINLGYVRVSGYRCFQQPVSSGNKFAPLVEYYERHKCFKEKKEKYGGDPTAYAKAVQACGYATSQTYAQGLIDAMNKYCFLEKTTKVAEEPESKT